MDDYNRLNNAIRLSDRERKVALRRLRSHHARGRIDAIELEERADAIGFARNHGDLNRVFVDLEPVGRAREPWAHRRGWFPLFPVLPLLVIATIILAATGQVPWVPLVILAVLLLLVAPWRRRRYWGRAGWAR